MTRIALAFALLLSLTACVLAEDTGDKPAPEEKKSETPAETGIAWGHDYTKASEEAVAAKKKLFIVFSTTWCGPCKRLQSVVWSDKAVGERVAKDFVPVKLDGDKEAALKKQFEITAYPTIILAEADGSVIVKQVGAAFATPEAAIIWLDEKLKTPGLLDGLVEAAKKNPQDPMAQKALADAYFKAGRKEDAAKVYAIAEKLLEDALIDVKLRQCESLIAKRDSEAVKEVLDELLPKLLKKKDERAIAPTLTFANLIARMVEKKDPAKAREMVLALIEAFPEHKRIIEFRCNAALYAHLNGEHDVARKEAQAVVDAGPAEDVWVDRAKRLIAAIDKGTDLSGKKIR